MPTPQGSPDPSPPTLLWLLAGPRRLVPSAAITTRLRQAPLFQGCGADEIQVETPSHAPAPQRCAHRVRLVRALATALEAYDRACARIRVTPQVMQKRTRAALEQLQISVTLYGYLRQKRLLQAASQPRPLQPTLEKALRTLHEVGTAVTPDHYADLIVPRVHETLTMELCAALQEAFATYGPSSGFPAIARSYALAQILIWFEIEPGSLARVAERLHKRAQRAAKPAQG